MAKQLQEKTLIRLDGQWGYALDPNDVGEAQQWYINGLPEPNNRLTLPGTLTTNGIGEAYEWDGELSKEAVRSLRQRHRYVGAAWYTFQFSIPQEWDGKRLILFFERVMFQSTLWLNGQFVGRQDSLSVPHQFDITHYVKSSEPNTIMVRIDNRDIHKLGEYPSAYTDETQTIWNGIIGRMELQVTDPVFIRNVQIYPNVAAKSVKLTGELVNTTQHSAALSLRVSSQLQGDQKTTPDQNPTPDQSTTSDQNSTCEGVSEQNIELVLTSASTKEFEIDYNMGSDVKLWDEFRPHLYDLLLTASAHVGGADFVSEQTYTFGMREFRSVGQSFEINGRPTFLRGTLECCIFPHTGHPPTDEASWESLLQTVKEYGLNHIRFHSWCPPKAAFSVADRLGVYVQAEGPVWMDTWNTPVGAHQEHYHYLPQEAKRIMDEYGNHPSFCIFSNGNELNGDFTLLHDIITKLKASDNRRLYTLTTNWDRPIDDADDLFCAQNVDGVGARGQYFPDELTSSTMIDFRDAVAQRDVPLLTHEVGQYTVYPDVEEIDKYTGALTPVNFEGIKVDLERKNLLQDIKKFVHGSGMLALQLYREEIEAALRTPKLGGFQLLDLHDFPGQSTATVGILNAFWESKGLIEPEQFRAFCSETVLLLRLPKRMYDIGEHFTAAVEIAHFGAAPLPPAELNWRILGEGGNIIDQGGFSCAEIPLGSGIALGSITSEALKTLDRSEHLTIAVEWNGGAYRNEWSIWVFVAPEQAGVHDSSDIIITEQWNEQVEEALAKGQSVLYIVSEELKNAAPGKYYPVFWSPVHFATENPCGIYVNAKHELFHDFPTSSYAEPHWKDLLDTSWSLSVDEFSAGMDSIVQVVPNFFHNRRLSNLLECRVGAGRVVICGLDIIQNMESRPAARQLRRSILSYMQGELFQPSSSVSMEELRKLLERKDREGAEHGLSGTELATGKPSLSDSVLNEIYNAASGNDGSNDTMWLAADEATGHWWQVDLGGLVNIHGTKVKFHCPGNFLYVIQTSMNGEQWDVVVNQTGQTSEEQIRIDAFEIKARYVRIVYNGLPPHVRAGHCCLEVYGSST